MSYRTNTAKSVESPMAFLDRLIEATPDTSEQETEYHKPPCLLRQAFGWGEKYIEPIDLHGERWLATFHDAKNVIAGRGIVALLGNRGTGKTRMAAEIARAGFFPNNHGEWNGNGEVRGKTARYLRTFDMFLDLRDAANSKTNSEKRALSELEKPGLLVMDEFHERGGSEWENRVISNLIDKRYAARRPTILIANYSLAEMTHAIGPSAVDRMRENGRAFVCDWESYRGRPMAPPAPPATLSLFDP